MDNQFQECFEYAKSIGKLNYRLRLARCKRIIKHRIMMKGGDLLSQGNLTKSLVQKYKVYNPDVLGQYIVDIRAIEKLLPDIKVSPLLKIYRIIMEE